jgi:hypothetical protein
VKRSVTKGRRPPLRPERIYVCGCGYRFEEKLGKYGCPNCCGARVARLVEVKQ